MAHEFRSAVLEVAAQDDITTVVVTGEPPVFSAGGDLAMIARQRDAALSTPERVNSELLDFYRSFLSVRELPVPVVAAVNGHAIGAGFCLALACDLRVISATAKFAMNFAAIGLHPGMGGSVLLPAAVGESRAAQLLYTGAITTGAELADTGWAVETVESGQVLDRALALAASVAANSPTAIRAIRRSLRTASAAELSRALAAEASAQVQSLRSDDLGEGLAALQGGWRPNFARTATATES
jgi:enoyl-CoA hydratase/carnithine racemase